MYNRNTPQMILLLLFEPVHALLCPSVGTERSKVGASRVRFPCAPLFVTHRVQVPLDKRGRFFVSVLLHRAFYTIELASQLRNAQGHVRFSSAAVT